MRRASFNLADLFEIVAAAVPDREAVVHGERRLTYAELDDRANRLASVLARQGVGPGDAIGLLLYNGSEYLEGFLAACKLRALAVNINYRYRAGEIRQLLDDADLVAVVHEPDVAKTLEELDLRAPAPRFLLARGPDYERALAEVEAEDGPRGDGRSGDDLYVLYTGGTTGAPKGVLWRHEDIFHAALGGGGWPPIDHPEALAERAGRGRARLLPASPLMHGSASWLALSTLFGGGTVVIAAGSTFDAAATWRLVADESVTSLVIVGDAFARPLIDEFDRQPTLDLSALTVILSGGATLSPRSRDALLGRLPGCMLVDGFGASETGGQGQMVAVAGASSLTPRFRMDESTAVLDRDLRSIAPGSSAVGLLARRGHIPLGYRNDPVRSAATFPVVDGVRWAIPGDLARPEDDGTITVFGRGSSCINTGGEKVHPEEVEVVLRSHADVVDAVVVGIVDDQWGERVAAVVHARPDASLSAAELTDHVRAKLADYKVPKTIAFTREIVRSPTGKPDYDWARRVAE